LVYPQDLGGTAKLGNEGIEIVAGIPGGGCSRSNRTAI
jgi:hypothetical protein